MMFEVGCCALQQIKLHRLAAGDEHHQRWVTDGLLLFFFVLTVGLYSLHCCTLPPTAAAAIINATYKHKNIFIIFFTFPKGIKHTTHTGCTG